MVSNIPEIAKTVTAHEEAFYQSAEFWVGAAFVLVCVALFSPIVKVIGQMTAKRITRIKDELKKAEDLKLEAQKLYADYERKFAQTDDEVAQIVTEQENIISENKDLRTRELNQMLKQKQAEAEARMELAFNQINTEIKTKVSQKTMEILYTVIKENLTPKNHEKLIDASIDNLKKLNMGKK